MTATEKPLNSLVGSLTIDTLNNVINSLLFINNYFLHASHTELQAEKEVLIGLALNIDQIIEALRYEKGKVNTNPI